MNSLVIPSDPIPEVPLVPMEAPEGVWTLAVLPDTQHYTSQYPEVFLRQTEWIAAHKESHRILFVAHEGDMVDVNTHSEWSVALAAMERLYLAGIPWSVSLGNHDLASFRGQTLSRQTLFNEYFPLSRLSYPSKGSERFGTFELGRLENHWQLLDTPTGPHLILALEYGPRDAVLSWANEVAMRFNDRTIIVIVHEYLAADATRFHWEARGMTQRVNCRSYPFAAGGDVNDGEAIWQKLVSRHPNIRCVLCGHVGGTGAAYLASPRAGAFPVHQIMANYLPDRGYGGGGFLRLMRFHPGGEVQVKSYSPWYDCWLTEPEHDFTLWLTPA